MRRVYVEKALVIETDIAPAGFPGDERDFLELCGNLLDNACKYGRSMVRLTALPTEDSIVLTVEDDGPGIDPDHRARVMERGARLDTRQSGQGIGLAVVAEIVERYRGQITIDASPLGGARVQATFPIG